MEHRKINLDKTPDTIQYSLLERRFTSGEPVQYRSSDGGGEDDMGEVFGYAIKWEVEYDMGWYKEKIARGALDNADTSDVRVLDNHMSNLVLGRTKSGTATIGKDDVGVWYRAKLPNSPNGQNMRESLKRGDIDQSSWGFFVRTDATGKRIGEKWEKRDGMEIRTITDVSLVLDMSPVTFPANPDTSAAKRSRDAAFEAEQAEAEAPQLREAPNTWEIGWMAETVAWMTFSVNTTIQSLNAAIKEYEYYANGEGDSANVFAELRQKCIDTKMSNIALIDAHADALKALNALENRKGEAAPTEHRSTEQKTNTNTPDDLELEFQLAQAIARANNN